MQKLWNSTWRPRNGCNTRAQLFNGKNKMAVQVNFVLIPSEAEMRQHQSPDSEFFVVIKLPSQPFLGCHLKIFHTVHFS